MLGQSQCRIKGFTMNELIRQLDKQARLWAIDNTNFPISSHIPSGYTEKFAELIVAECIEIAQDRANFPGFPPNDVNDIIDEIREHFEVEE